MFSVCGEYSHAGPDRHGNGSCGWTGPYKARCVPLAPNIKNVEENMNKF